ncbi:c5.1 [Ichnoviriform fugitivi]|uniref:C5.1 n=1 Tax=Ichnoviriform fugitivi TaxID=265522 RepID=A2Q0G6_9VIRU|nr:c5.1 [Ichnoviriform fugitivi]BAF45681.1 c5.1 [Ichnoviriform fugitivi]
MRNKFFIFKNKYFYTLSHWDALLWSRMCSAPRCLLAHSCCILPHALLNSPLFFLTPPLFFSCALLLLPTVFLGVPTGCFSRVSTVVCPHGDFVESVCACIAPCYYVDGTCAND